MPNTDRAAPLCAAFLRALGACGNVGIAAREAGASKGFFYRRRKTDMSFALACGVALERAGVRLGAGVVPGVEAAASGEGVAVWCARGGSRARVTRIADRTRKWTAGAERVFLSELAATANVRAACAAAGFSTTAIYRRRALWPAFREAWDVALDQGYARIELMLVVRATATLDPVGAALDGIDGGPEMSTAEALNLLRLHRASARGGAAQRYDARAKPPDIEKVRAGIMKRIRAIAGDLEEEPDGRG